MRRTVERFIKNVSRKWSNTGQLATWPVGKLPSFCWSGKKIQVNVIWRREREGTVDRAAPLCLSEKGWCVSGCLQLLPDNRPRGSGSTCHGQMDQM